MKSPLRHLPLIIAGCLVGAFFWAALQQHALSAATPKVVVAIAAPALPPIPQPPPTRIRYSEGSYPSFSLPGGRQEIVRSVLNITKPMRFGDFVWDDKDIPKGDVWVRVDLARQLLSVFRDGNEIGSSVILFGTDGKPTPTGNFTVLQKDADHYSSSYDAPMPYMLRLTNDGVAIHGSNVREGYATHGCVGVPIEFARLLFGAMAKGDRVVIFPIKSDKKA
ncbi:MAG TPA: L,D-transpeptidase family protein [Rhizomicrobium sp.]